MPPKILPSKTASEPGTASKSGTPKPGGRPKSGGLPKSGKKDAGSKPVTAAPPGEDLSQKIEQMEKERLKDEQARNFLQLERDKISAFWEVTRRELNDKCAELRIKDKDIEELQDKHGVELRVYKQKVKHLLYEHQSHISKLKADGEAALKQAADTFARQEAELGDDKRRLKQHIKEQELSSVELLKQFRLENAKTTSKLRQEFELQARQIQQKYEAQLKEMQEALQARYDTELREVEDNKNTHIQNLMASHDKAFKEMKAYYNEITHANLDLIKTLKEEIVEMKRNEAKQEKLLHDVARENKRLTTPLAKAVQEVETLRQAVSSAERDRNVLASATARLAGAERQVKALEWENEVLTQRLELVQRERDELAAKFDGAVRAVQQRSSLRAVVLEKKLEAMSSEMERMDSQLAAALSQRSLPSSKRATARGRHSARDASPLLHASPQQATHSPSQASDTPVAAAHPALQQQEQQCSQPVHGTAATDAHGVASCSSGAADSLLATALKTSLPDLDDDIFEGETPAAILRQLESMQAKEAVASAAGGTRPTLTAVGLEAKLAQAAAAAEDAVAGAMRGGELIPAARRQVAL